MNTHTPDGWWCPKHDSSAGHIGTSPHCSRCRIEKAGPELLAALRDLLRAYENWDKPCPLNVVQAAYAAIDKAKGTTP